ncbi:hypothetical protein FGM00_07160 [Aggregatimonas sangjinii]|uniref:Type VI secretion system baseplate subunit TssG n=1 Tax=Aggregatimonas sangjinii TaxID=2583587 RepID=A0A5B7SRA7_9FLAO|nr:hypothetical protein [Aggregatimonas sangjinii]QCW99888.1 hypothetical protein FGM00_07160 [Aggregatimonas sangjinii]
MKTVSPYDIRQEVFDLGFDLKAETFISYLEHETELDISLTDFFKRRFSKDITAINENLEKDGVIDVLLSRRGFYNIFPERFFHSTYSSTPYVETMVADYNGRKIEEENARKFFKPLETEFFLQRVDIETAEDRTFRSLGSPELVRFLMDLWKIDQKIPQRMAAKILKTMPFMYKIAGNMPLLKLILENIIEEHLVIEHDFASIGAETFHEPWQLGVNMATAGKPKTFLPKYIFTIDKISRPDEIGDYLPQGKLIAVVNFFLEHTLPYESEFEVRFTLAPQKTKFVIGEAVYAGRLGVSATI